MRNSKAQIRLNNYLVKTYGFFAFGTAAFTLLYTNDSPSETKDSGSHAKAAVPTPNP